MVYEVLSTLPGGSVMMSLLIYCATSLLFILNSASSVCCIKCDTSDGHSDTKCEHDVLGFEAIRQLHDLIDDDHNGNLDRSESDEFFRDELKHEDCAARQATFHGSDDLISVNDLWQLWTVSEVYNWTVNDVIDWLIDDVNLPKYVDSFRVNEVDGHILPRIAVNSQYVTSILGIKNPVHRQKLSLKATDLVLFGYKKKETYWLKDLLFACLLGIALTVAWLSQREKKLSQNRIIKVLTELESLQRSEERLKTLQRQYEETKRAHQETAMAKQTLEQKLEDEVTAAKMEAERLRKAREHTEEELSRLKLAELELVEVRKALSEAERRLELMSSELPQLIELQQWLQLTYEIETQYYETKKEAAEKLLKMAREMCDKIHKKRSGLLGSFRVAHSLTVDDTDQSIMQARCALEEVRLHLQERNQRWQEIERICGFDIIHNPGLHILETTLRGIGSTFLTDARLAKSASVSTFSAMSMMPLDHELDEDVTSSQLAAGVLTASDLTGCHGASSSVNNFSKVSQHHFGAGGSLSNLSKSHIPGSVSGRYSDRRVWPNLMKAGMQLTMFGLGLTNPQLGAVQPGVASGDLQDKHKSLVEILSGRTCTAMRKQRTLPQQLASAETDVTKLQRKTNGILQAEEENEIVTFSLGDSFSKPSPTEEVQRMVTDRTIHQNSLHLSASESLLHGGLGKIHHEHLANRRTGSQCQGDAPLLEEVCQQGSSESLECSLDGDKKNLKKTALKNIFKPKKKKES